MLVPSAFVQPFVEIFRRLRAADDRLQPLMEDLHRRYWAFVGSGFGSGPYGSHRSILALRAERDPRTRRFRRLSWGWKLKGKIRVSRRSTRTIRPVKRLHGPMRSGWIYLLARDYAHKETYFAIDWRAQRLNTLRSAVVCLERDLTLALRNGWARRASPEARERAVATLRELAPGDPPALRDLTLLEGILALASEAGRLEEEIGRTIEEYRRALRSRVDFEPCTRRNPNGTYRLFWGAPQRVHTREGTRTFTEYLPGWPTDRRMRQLGLPAATRRQVGIFKKRLLALHREYRDLEAFLVKWKHREGLVRAQLEKFLAQPPEAALLRDRRI